MRDPNVFERIRKHPMAPGSAIVIALLLLSLITGFSQIKTEGLGWQEANYMPRLEAVVAGEAPAPDQFRVLTDNVVVAMCRVTEAIRVPCRWVRADCPTGELVGIPRAVGVTLVLLRLLQNFALFGLAYGYYRALKLTPYAIVIGLSALAWGMTQSNYGSTLAFDAYTDMLFYLLAALALLHQRYYALILITVLAALNRETALLLPLMAGAYALSGFAPRSRALLRTAAASLVLFGMIQLALHLYFGPRDWAVHPSGATPGLSMLRYNLGSDAAWGHVAGTLGLVPLLALVTWRQWHPLLRPLCWAVVPVWFLGHLLCAPLDQSRVLLLPMVLVFVPGMLCGLSALQGTRDQSEAAA